MDMKSRVGMQIKILRQNRSLSQAELSEMIDRSVDAVSAIERGKSLPNFDTLERLADALKVPVKEFFDVDDEEISPKRAAMLTDINDKLRAMSDADLKTSLGLITTIAKR